MNTNIKFYGDTNVGKIRQNNEDNFLILNLKDSSFYNINSPIKEVLNLETDKEFLLAVADGLGGALAGEIASQLAVDIVRKRLIQLQKISTFNEFPFYEKLRLAIEMVNQAIIQNSLGNVQYTGMGSTFTGVTICKDVAYIAQVGDSRAYLIRDNKIIQLTKDQSLVWQLLDAGYITEEEAENHHLRNVILQALGGQAIVNVVITRVSLKVDDILLVCSDGLTTSVKNQQILDVITSSLDLKTATENLIAIANEHGGQDNITIVLAKIDKLENSKQIVELGVETLLRDVDLPRDINYLDLELNQIKPLAKESVKTAIEDSPTTEVKVVQEVIENKSQELVKPLIKKDPQHATWWSIGKILWSELLKFFRFAT